MQNKSTLAREQSASNSSAENRRSRVTMNDLVKERRASAERFASVETQDKGTTEKTPKDTARLADGLRERQEGHTQAHSTLVHTNVTGHATGKDVINASSREKESTTEKAGGKIRWGFWDDYAKVTVEGREYAQVGDRLFTRHAVDRMTPSGLGTAAGGAKGRSVSPNFIEDVLTSPKSSRISMKGPDGEARVSHQLGTLQVITENDIVITVITH